MKPKKAEYGYLREAFMVKRYHTVGHVAHEETVGQHTVNVVAMIFWLYDDEPPLYMVRRALHHDAPELATGDIPATTKWEFPNLAAEAETVEVGVAIRQGLETKDLTDKEEAVLKFADMIDLCFKSVEELAYGNDSFAPILGRGLMYIDGLLDVELKTWPQAHELRRILKANPFINIEEFHVTTTKESGATCH